jgi:hypothetical protein
MEIDQEGRERFRGKIGTQQVVGNCRYHRGMLTICWNDAEKDFPKRFEDGEQRDLVTLWRR